MQSPLGTEATWSTILQLIDAEVRRFWREHARNLRGIVCIKPGLAFASLSVVYRNTVGNNFVFNCDEQDCRIMALMKDLKHKLVLNILNLKKDDVYQYERGL